MSTEERIADALKTLSELWLAPMLAAMASPGRVEVIEADLTKAQAAKVLGIHPRTVNRLIERGELRGVYGAGAATRVPRAALEAYRLAHQKE